MTRADREYLRRAVDQLVRRRVLSSRPAGGEGLPCDQQLKDSAGRLARNVRYATRGHVPDQLAMQQHFRWRAGVYLRTRKSHA